MSEGLRVSQFNDPRHIEHQQAMASAGTLVLDRHRACRACAYDLSGLKYGGKCPECGAEIRFITSMEAIPTDRLMDVSPWYARAMGMCLFLCAAGWLSLLALPLYARGGAETWLAHVALWGSVAWCAGILPLALPRPSSERVRRDLHDGVLRRIACAGVQALAPVAAVSHFVAANNTTGPWPLIATVATCAALLALVPAAWLLGEFADWMQDTDRTRILCTFVPWQVALAILVTLGGTFRLPIGVPSKWLVLGLDILPILLVIGHLYLTWHMLHLAREAGWSAIMGRSLRVRDAELRDQTQRERAAHAERVADAPFIPDGPAFIPAPDRKW